MSKEVVTVVLDNIHATRKYPFSEETLKKLAEIRHSKEKELNDANKDRQYMVPAPVVLAEAIDLLHDKYFP
jgi:hypothetical protein